MPWTHETPTRVRFKTLLKEGYSQRAAASKLGIPRSSAQYFLDKPNQQAKPPGAPSIISDAQIEEIIKWFTGHFNRRQLSLQQIREQFKLNYYDNTLLRAFKQHGYHYHTPDCLNAGVFLSNIGIDRKSIGKEADLQMKRLHELIFYTGEKSYENEKNDDD
ncbi:hypothetical protein IFR05_014675 [Cadophora sp. M221]|nr:hypothetical protein IFR05_014675 [Cadophora sp. M221]